MKAIDTFYNGNYFRSRLEARWAYFFDVIGVEYEYEQKGFKSDNGEMYLPDFYLPETYLRDFYGKGVYVEIKPESYIEGTLPCKKWFTKNLVLFAGTPQDHVWDNTKTKDILGVQIYPCYDTLMKFWHCRKCGTTKIDFSEGNYGRCPRKLCNGVGSHDINMAAVWAQKKRFEHGAA